MIKIATIGFLTATLTGCLQSTSGLTLNELKASAYKVNQGMSRAEVESLFGKPPANVSFRGSAMAITYCSNAQYYGDSNNSSTFETVWLKDGVVEGKTTYSDYASPDRACSGYFREIDWGQLPNDLKILLDIK